MGRAQTTTTTSSTSTTRSVESTTSTTFPTEMLPLSLTSTRTSIRQGGTLTTLPLESTTTTLPPGCNDRMVNLPIESMSACTDPSTNPSWPFGELEYAKLKLPLQAWEKCQFEVCLQFSCKSDRICLSKKEVWGGGGCMAEACPSPPNPPGTKRYHCTSTVVLCKCRCG